MLVVSIAAFFLFWLGSAADLFAQASLAAENQLNDVVINVNGEEDTYTCIQDGRESNQWYYVPNRPRLATKGKDKMPVFHLLKFQAKSPENDKELVEGGILQFSVKLAAPDGAVPQMKAAIGKLKNIPPDKVQIGPLPITSAEVTMYDPDGDMLVGAPMKPGIAPAFANQEMPFQVRFNKLGADVYESLVRGGGGLPVSVSYSYNGLTPPMGFTITADWDQTFKHLSTDTKAKADFGSSFWSVSAEVGVSTTNEDTLKKMGVTVKKIASADGSSGPSSKELQDVIDPILARIAETVAEDFKPFDKVDPAKANTPNPKKAKFFSGGVSFSLKSENKRKRGKETWEWSEQQVIERHSMCGGLIGVGHLPKAQQDKLVTIMPPGNWASAYYSLPAVGDDPVLGIKQIDITVMPVDKNKKQITGVKAETGTWKADTGEWQDKKKAAIDYFLFPMQGVYAKYDDKGRAELQYEVKLKISQDKNVLTFVYYEPMIDGDVPVSTPMDAIEPFVVNCNWLTFAEKGDKEGLAGVSVQVAPKFPNKKYTLTVKSNSENMTPCFLVEKATENRPNPIKVDLSFIKVGQTKGVPWKGNSNDARKDFPGLEIFLWDKDYE
jgi:hypothetical protein